MSLLTSCRGKEGRKGHIEGERDKGSERVGGGSMVWHDMLCVNRRCRRVIAVELSKWQEGRGGEETVMDTLARGRAVAAQCGMSCRARIAIAIVSFPLRGQEGRREEGGSDGCVGAMVWCVVHALSPLLCCCRRTIVLCVVTMPLPSRRQEG